jgi:PAS domain S-box-containing protein
VHRTEPWPPATADLPALIGEPFRDALDGIDLPMYAVDREGTLRWANRAALRFLGHAVGSSLVSRVPPDVRSRVQKQLVVSLVGGEATVEDIVVTTPEGRRAGLRVRTAPIRDGGRSIGVFALALPMYETRPEPPGETMLTPRQSEVLRLLAEGLTTEAVAERLGVALETARNHIRAVLRRLDVHSRLEAVVEARQRGLLDD